MSQDAIVMLKADHKEVRGLFREFQKASTTPARKGKLVEKIIELLTVHTYIENEVMYPRVRALLPDLEDDVLESYEEHHVADLLVMELVPMTSKDERFEAKATVLIENVTHHIEEEEQDWFPKVREGLTRTQLREIGAELAAAKEKAPRRPEQPSALKKTLDARHLPDAHARRRPGALVAATQRLEQSPSLDGLRSLLRGAGGSARPLVRQRAAALRA